MIKDHLDGITLDMVKVQVSPRGERMRDLITLKTFGLSELDAVRYSTAMTKVETTGQFKMVR